MPTYNEALLEAYASCPPNEKTYFTLVVNHPSFDEPAYLVTGVGDDMEFGLENGGGMQVHQAVPFKSDPPEQREGQAPQAKVSIDNVNRELMPKIRAAMGIRAFITVAYREYVDSDLTEPAFGPVEYILSGITAIGTTLTGTVMVKNLQNRRFPKDGKDYSPNVFRSLLQG